MDPSTAPQRPGASARRPPAWTVRVVAVGAAVLMLAVLAWLGFQLLLLVPLVTLAVAAALLLTALLAPLAGWLRRVGVPRPLAALTTVLLLLAVLAGIGALAGFRVVSRLRDLTGPLAASVDRIRVWLTEGPLGLDPQQVASIRDQVVGALYDAAPSPVAGARMVVFGLTALVLVVFLVFFLLADGDRMWGWLVVRVPQRRQEGVDGAGRAAWTTLVHYVHGVVVVAVIDAVGIGAALLLLGVPLWLSLTLLVFLGAFVPILGATLTGAVAVLVTLVTEDVGDAVVVLVVVLVVQQLEGNVLQPLIMGRAVRLHPVVILLAVTVATLLFGVAGAVVAVPVVAVAYQVAEYLRTSRPAALPPGSPVPEPPVPGSPAAAAAGSSPPAAPPAAVDR